MYFEHQITLSKNPLLKKYLREHSFYYKLLNRDPRMMKELIDNMQKEYKLTINDRIDKVKDNLSMLNSFIDILN